MKKLILTALILAGSHSWSMTNMPEGVYQGQGQWRDNQGQSGHYDIRTTVQANVVSSIYLTGESSKNYEFKAKEGSNGQFDVYVNNYPVGQGYCMTVQCHYEISFGDAVVEETLTFYQDHLYRIGSKQTGDKSVNWEESMKKEN